MTKVEEYIIKVLIKNGVLTTDIVPEISEKMDIGLTLGEVLIGDNYVNQDGFVEILVDIYKRRQITLEEINEKFYVDTKTFLQGLAEKLKMTYMNLDDVDVDFRISEKAPTAQLKKYAVIPVKVQLRLKMGMNKIHKKTNLGLGTPPVFC